MKTLQNYIGIWSKLDKNYLFKKKKENYGVKKIFSNVFIFILLTP